MRYLFLLLLIGGCMAHSAAFHQSVRKITVGKDGTTTVEFRVEGTSSSSAPGPTSQPTTAEASDEGAYASASGEQSMPLSVYGLEQRQWIFYGGALVIALAGAVAMWRGKATLAWWLFAVAGVALLAETFLKVYAVYVVGCMLVLGVLWVFKNYYEDAKGLRSGIKLNLEGKPEEATAALRQTPTGSKVKKDAPGTSSAGRGNSR